jgi:hypothetical protein
METEELLARWHVLLNEPGKAIAARGVLQERQDVLHRLNELGTRTIEGSQFLPRWRRPTFRCGNWTEQARLAGLPDTNLTQRRQGAKTGNERVSNTARRFSASAKQIDPLSRIPKIETQQTNGMV